MMKRLDHYIFAQILAVTTLISMILVGIMLMTQSLRFLDLIISSGASGLMFLTLTLLALPRFLEIIIPVSFAIGSIYVFVRLRQDGEMTILNASGLTPFRIARAGLICAGCFSMILFIVLASIAPHTLARMYELRQLVRVQYSTSMLREGVFNTLGPDITVFIAKKSGASGLSGLMIYDARPENKTPVTILAQSGEWIMTDDGPQIQIIKGVSLSKNKDTQSVDRLEFDEYRLDLPEISPLSKRWAEPEERTLSNLMTTAPNDKEAQEKWGEFRAEIHRRFLSPLLPLCLYFVVAAIMIKGSFTRIFHNAGPILYAVLLVLILQGFYLGAFSMAKTSIIGISAMYIIVFAPMIISFITLWSRSFMTSSDISPVTPAVST